MLRPVLRVFGLIFIFGIPLFNRIWPSGWAWVPEQPAYLQMIWGIRDARRVLAARRSRPGPTPEPDLVHCLVEHRAWDRHGGPLRDGLWPDWAPRGRCRCAVSHGSGADGAGAA